MRIPRHGRNAADFAVGEVYRHPWEVTIDAGMIAMFHASFLDAMPVFSSVEVARAMGLRDRPVPTLLLLNLGLSFSVHDVSEQAIAHLAYLDVRFPGPCYPGDTVTAASKVLGVTHTRTGDRAVVHVRTALRAQSGDVVCAFERKALVPAGLLEGRTRAEPAGGPEPRFDETRRQPMFTGTAPHRSGFGRSFEDFAVGDVLVHAAGRTAGESEHMQLSWLLRNTHPLHTDEIYAKTGGSFAGTRVVYGGLVLAWTAALASRDVAGDAIWDLGWADGAHPAGVVAGDTIYAASKVIAKSEDGAVTFRLVGTKNVRADALLERGLDLFAPEADKSQKIPEKVFEGTRTLLLRTRG